MPDHRLGGRGVVVADVIDPTRTRRVDRGQQHLRDIGGMDAREDLAGLDDASRRARAQLGKGTASGTVNARQSKDMQGQAVFGSQFLPRPFGGHAVAPAPGRGGQSRPLIHPAAIAVAIDAGRGQIAQPARAGAGEIGGECGQHRVAALIRPCRDQDGIRPGDGVAQGVLIAGPEQGRRARGKDALGRVAGGAGDLPALGQQKRRQETGRVAMAQHQRLHARPRRISAAMANDRIRASGS